MKKAFIVYIILCMFFPTVMEAEKKTFGNGLFWEITDDGTLTISGRGNMPDFVINNRIKRAPWHSKARIIQNVVIENGVTSIGKEAFADSWQLNEHNQLVANGDNYYVFKKVIIPNTVSLIDDRAFKNCINLTSVEIPNSVTSIGSEAFSGCLGLSSVELSNSVSSIEERSFYGCSSLTSVEIPNSVKTIGDEAFSGCDRITSVVIPNSVKKIGSEVFNSKSLNDIFVNITNWSSNSVLHLCFPNNSEWKYCVNNIELSDVIIPDSVKIIGKRVLYNGKSIKSITIPEGVTKIADYAFKGCSGITQICIPNSVTIIGNGTFTGCTSLVNILIPDAVTTIGNSAFEGCNSLSSIILPNTVISLGTGVFHNCSSLSYVVVPKTLENVDSRSLFKSNSSEIEIYKGMDLPLQHKATKFYIVENKGKNGIISSTGEWLLPFEKGYTQISSFGDKYFKVYDGKYYGIIDIEGQDVIPTSRCYINIGDLDSQKSSFTFTGKGFNGVCDIKGREILRNKLLPSSDEIMEDGGYSTVTEINNGNTKYYKVSKGDRYGLTDAEGKEIVPCEMEALESIGSGFLKYKINGFWGVINYTGKIIIDTDRGYTYIGNFLTFTKRFPYVMNGYKGECDVTGRQISKIKVEAPRQSDAASSSESSSSSNSSTSSSSSNSSSNTGSVTTQTVVVEHHHDPMPVQEWQQCVGCFGSGQCPYVKCGGSGWYYIGDRVSTCSMCHGSGKCHYCNGQGGRYITVYR